MPPENHDRRAASPTARLALCGMMAALIFVATYFVKLPMAMTNGYVHLGDGFILLSASMLGWAAVPAAAVGSMLADLMGGYAMYLLHIAWLAPAQMLVRDWGWLAGSAVALAGLLLSCWTLHVLVEEPARTLGRAWAARMLPPHRATHDV